MDQFRTLDKFDTVYKPRYAWGPEAPLKGVPKRLWPAKYVFCGYHEHPWKNNTNLPPGILSIMRELKLRQHMDFKMGYPDIRYNFMITSNGKSYEGRGWQHTPGLTRQYAKFSPDSVYISYIGDFSESPPPEEYHLLRDELLQFGVKKGYLSRKFTLWNISLPITYKLNEFENNCIFVLAENDWDFGTKIVPRADWEKVSGSYVPRLPHPAQLVFVGYPPNSYNRSKVGSMGFIERLHTIQYVDMRKYPDIKYNFVIGDDGKVYEGRGWYSVPSIPLRYKNLSFNSVYIALIGDFERSPPRPELFELKKELILYGIRKGFISKKHALITMRNNVRTELEPYNYFTSRATSSLL